MQMRPVNLPVSVRLQALLETCYIWDSNKVLIKFIHVVLTDELCKCQCLKCLLVLRSAVLEHWHGRDARAVCGGEAPPEPLQGSAATPHFSLLSSWENLLMNVSVLCFATEICRDSLAREWHLLQLFSKCVFGILLFVFLFWFFINIMIHQVWWFPCLLFKLLLLKTNTFF